LYVFAGPVKTRVHATCFVAMSCATPLACAQVPIVD
jgi:hypothetical protein